MVRGDFIETVAGPVVAQVQKTGPETTQLVDGGEISRSTGETEVNKGTRIESWL